MLASPPTPDTNGRKPSGFLPEYARQGEMAEILGVSDRQLRNLEAKPGFPAPDSSAPDDKPYHVRTVRAWYIKFKQDEALSRVQRETESDLEEAQKRKVLAEARLAEIKVAREEGSLIPLDIHTHVVGELCDRLRAVAINMRTTYALDLEKAGIPPKQAEDVLEVISQDLIRALRSEAEAVEAVDDDADD